MEHQEQPLSLKITAASSFNKGADVVWRVTLALDDAIVAQDIPLVDPYNDFEASECKWYLEAFAPTSPYETGRAMKASGDIDRYGRSLIGQLQLGKLVEDGLKGKKQDDAVVEIVVEESRDSSIQYGGGGSIHRLYWECLERPEYWSLPTPPRTTVVRRRIQLQANQQLVAPKKSSEPEAPFSILLVTARDCSITVTKEQEIDPFVIASILLDVRKSLLESGHSRAFNVEIVRPGTFSAFETHLSQKFDLVHFDLHGRVRKIKGKSVACLQFAAEDSPEDLSSVSAGKVSALLREHSISFVVLNSCKSAQAGGGDDANLAKAFVGAGIANVLAMSMSVSQTAASIFVRSFYGSLVLDGYNFARSVAAGRESLRRQTRRPTRFGDYVDVKDWLIPVLYTSETDFQHHLLTDAHSSVYSLDHDLQRSSLSFQGVEKALLSGRHFDILRLERHMLQHPVIFLTGRSGVGKTALLHTLKSLWESTGFFEIVVYIDFTSKKFHSMASIAREVLLQLGLVGSNSPLGDGSEPTAYSQQGLVEAISSRKCALLFDGLHNSHSQLSEHVVPCIFPNVMRLAFNNFVSQMAQRKMTVKTQPPLIILAGRRTEIEWWKARLEPVNCQSETLFHLEGLDMAYAVPLARQLSGIQEPKSEDASVAESENLEILVRLFQANPLSMHMICPFINLTQKSKLNELMFESVPAVVAAFRNLENTFMSELQHLCNVLPHNLALIWRSLSLFWQEGPLIASWTETISKLGGLELSECVVYAFQVAADRGLLEYAPGQVSWIHPLFTIYLRLLFPQRRDNSGESEQMMSEAEGILLKELLGPLHEAALLRKCTTDAIQARLLVFAELDGKTGVRFEAVCNRLKRATFNAFTCIRACTEHLSGRLPLVDCPLDGISYYTPFSRQILLRSELSHLTELFISAVNRLANEFNGLAIPSQYRMLALQTLNHLTVVHKSEMRRPFAEVMEYSDKCKNMIEASEAAFGPMEGSLVLWHKSLCFKYRAFFFLSELREEEANDAWGAMMEVDRLIFDEGPPKPGSLDADVAGSSLAPLSSEADLTDAGENTNSVRKAWRELKHKLWNDHKRMIAALKAAEGTSNLATKNVVDFTDSSRALLGVSEAFKDLGIQGFSTDPRWWPSRHDLNKLLTHSGDRTARMGALQRARDNGSWMEAANHHLWLADAAQKEADVDVALHHLRECRDIRERLNSKDEELQTLMKRIEHLQGLQEFSKLARAADRDALAKDYEGALGSHDQLISLVDSLDLGSDAIKTQLREQLKAQRDHHEFMASARKSLVGDYVEDVSPEEKERRHRNYEAVYTEVGKQIGFAQRDAFVAEYNKHLQYLLKSVSSANIDEMLRASSLLFEAQKTPLFVALQSLPEWSKQFKETRYLRTRLLQARAVEEERWEDAVDLTAQVIDDLDAGAPESVRQELHQELCEYNQNRIRCFKALDALRVRANHDQNWESAISLTERMLAQSRTVEARDFLSRELETTRVNMYHHSFQQECQLKDVEGMLRSMKALRQIAELQNLPEDSNSSNPEKLDLAEIITTVEFLEKLVVSGTDLEQAFWEQIMVHAFISALVQGDGDDTSPQ